MSPTSTSGDTWKLAARAEKMNPSVIREILKVTEKPGIISFAGGLPSPKTFPIAEFDAASHKVLSQDGQAALQYAASEGYAPLREAIADLLPWNVDPAQVLITTGSQQALDLIAKVLIDTDSRILVETPTYLVALQAFAPMEPPVVAVASDNEGVLIADLAPKVGSGADKARFLYVLPNFQNPTGRTMTEARRAALVEKAAQLGLPLVGVVFPSVGGCFRRLLVVGDGPVRQALEEQARRLGLANRVGFTGVIHRDQVPAHVAAFDVVLQPAVTPYASPLKLMEYLVLGKAIIAPSTPNLRETLTHESNALLFDESAPGSLEQALTRLCTDSDLRARLALGAVQTIDRLDLTWGGNARRVVTLVEELP